MHTQYLPTAREGVYHQNGTACCVHEDSLHALFCRYQTNSVVCHIQKLAVHPDHRRQGIASTLLLVS